MSGECCGKVLRYRDAPDGYFRFLRHWEPAISLAADIGTHMPEGHARRIVGTVIDQFMLLVEALYECGWQDLLAPLEVVFETTGSPLDAARELYDLGLIGQFGDLACAHNDLARITGERLTGPGAVAEGHAVVLGHDDSSSSGEGTAMPCDPSVGALGLPGCDSGREDQQGGAA